jgi:hypothetical protein
VFTIVGGGDTNRGTHFGDLIIDRSIIIKCMLKKQGEDVCAGHMWIRIESRWQAGVNAILNFRISLLD